MKNILITGSAGFIGSSLVYDLLDSDYRIIAVDNLNEYYDVELKKRLKRISNKLERTNASSDKYKFHCLDLIDKEEVNNLFSNSKPDVVCHLAAQAGVRYSIENPHTYIEKITLQPLLIYSRLVISILSMSLYLPQLLQFMV